MHRKLYGHRCTVTELQDDSDSLHSGDESGSVEDESSDSDFSDQGEGKRHAHIPLGERVTAQPHKQGAARTRVLNAASAHDSLLNKRINKHAPVEERTSRRPVSTLRDSVQRKKHKPKDPRFLPHMRTDDPKEQDFANRRYNFLYEDAIPSEVKELKASMKKARSAHEKLRAQTKLSRLQETLRRHSDRKLEQEVETEWKQQEKAKMEAGKNPFYLKESEKKRRILEKKFAQLEETGQLEKYMSKKRKRQASKMRKQLPGRRNFQE